MKKSLPILGACGFALAAVLTPASAQQENADGTIEAVVTDYVAAWGEPNAVKRRQLLDKVWSPSGTYVDPSAQVQGLVQLTEHIGAAQKTMPAGIQLSRTSAVDMHHHLIRFTWKITLSDGSNYLEGIDFGEVDESGRLRSITGFFGPTKSLAR